MRRIAALGAALVVAGCASRPATAPVQVVDVTAGDFFFRAPDTIRAGRTEFRMTNAGGHHILVIARLDSGRTLADVMAVPDTVSESPAWMVDMGGPITGDSNGVISATLDLTPGRWLLYCYFGDDNGVPHYAKGMVKELIVAGPAAAPSPASDADVIVTVTDFDFTLSRPITAGRHTIRFVNTGAQGHEVIIDRLNEGAHLADWVEARRQRRPRPARSAGGLGGLPAGQTMDLTTDVAPGNYVWFCYFDDAATGKKHTELGMIKEVRVE